MTWKRRTSNVTPRVVALASADCPNQDDRDQRDDDVNDVLSAATHRANPIGDIDGTRKAKPASGTLLLGHRGLGLLRGLRSRRGFVGGGGDVGRGGRLRVGDRDAHRGGRLRGSDGTRGLFGRRGLGGRGRGGEGRSLRGSDAAGDGRRVDHLGGGEDLRGSLRGWLGRGGRGGRGRLLRVHHSHQSVDPGPGWILG